MAGGVDGAFAAKMKQPATTAWMRHASVLTSAGGAEGGERVERRDRRGGKVEADIDGDGGEQSAVERGRIAADIAGAVNEKPR